MGYINANRISELIESRLDGLEFMSKDRAEAYEMAIRAALRVIEHAPTADVQSVVHGKWEEVYDINSQDYNSDNNWWLRCSYCRSYTKISFKKQRFDYCPHCGAKMDGTDNEN